MAQSNRPLNTEVLVTQVKQYNNKLKDNDIRTAITTLIKEDCLMRTENGRLEFIKVE